MEEGGGISGVDRVMVGADGWVASSYHRPHCWSCTIFFPESLRFDFIYPSSLWLLYILFPSHCVWFTTGGAFPASTTHESIVMRAYL